MSSEEITSKRGQFTFYRSFWDAISNIPKKDRLPILEAIIQFGLDGAEPQLSGMQLAIFSLVKPTLISSQKKSANGKLGGSKPKANSKQSVTEKEVESEKEVEIEEEEEKEKENEYSSLSTKKNIKKKFQKPSIDEVKTYCQENGYSVDAQTFVDFYESKGWLVGKNPMKDWQAAVRTWEKSDRGYGYGRDKYHTHAAGARGEMGEAELEAIRRTLNGD